MKIDKAKVAIIGSGLSAYGAILAALESNASITVLDVGENLPAEIALQVSRIRNTNSKNLYLDVAKLSRQSSELNLKNSEMPKKTLFGSQYFYHEEQLKDLNKLPFSQAFGGYSVAWGGAVLPPNENDLALNAFDYKDLTASMNLLSKHVSMPFFEDNLTEHFPNFGKKSQADNLELSSSQKLLLNRLLRIQNSDPNNILIFGQSRLLTKTSGPDSCRYCGMCSHGCAYNSIFSSEHEIRKFVNEGRVEYFSRRKVIEVRDFNGKARIDYLNLANGLIETFEADYVLVAAGAVNSTKIALKSLRLENEVVRFQKTGGFVRPYFSFRKIGFDWPKQNTQANIFMEIKDVNLSKFWIHSQVSSPNDIVVLGLGYLNSQRVLRPLTPLKRLFLNHLVIVMTNLHSSEGPFYDLKAKPVGDNLEFNGVLEIPESYRKFENRVEKKIKKTLSRIGLFAIPFTRKGVSNGPGYHIGGSMPIGGTGKLATDELGRFTHNSKISFVDTSVLPSIPATTIGFLTMANAHRITTKVLKS
jgi:choline dehydrogenase-like flavoprotein